MKNEYAAKIGSLYMIIFSIILIFIIIFYFSLFDIDVSKYTEYVLNLKTDIYNKPLVQLLMGNTLINLPNVIINTNNEYINNLQECKKKAIYMGPNNGSDYLNKCKFTCGGVGALYTIEEGNEFYQDGSLLEPGIYCMLDPPQCNLNTSFVLATVNSTVCRSKYPNMFGGETGGTITACNDERYPATGSILWDYANNEQVFSSTVNMTHEDEKLSDGSYRFRCKYTETGAGNPFIENPIARFHPIEDKCNSTIYRASYDVHAVVNSDKWYCECGDYEITRVKNLERNNIKSICTSCFNEIIVINDSKKHKKSKIPYLCFNQESSWKMAIDLQPCLDLPANGNTCGVYEQEFILHNYEIHEDRFPTEYGLYTKDFLAIDIPSGLNDQVFNHRYLDTR